MKYYRRKIGVFGGSFDPVHKGHLSVAAAAHKELNLDEVWFLPAWIQPFKQEKHAESALHRKKMLELVIEDMPYCSVCDYELKKKGVSYTCETLAVFKEQYSDAHFYFIMGADSLDTFSTWRHPREICDCASIIVAGRHRTGKSDKLEGEARQLDQMFGADIHFLHTPFYDISSTQIRNMSLDDLHQNQLIPGRVLDYICKYGLYGKGKA